MYPVESILDNDRVFRAIHKTLIRNNEIVSGKAFRFDANGCSVEWSKYSTPEKTRAFNLYKSPAEYGAAFLVTGEVRSQDMAVIHDPLPSLKVPEIDNQAHSLIIPPSQNPEDIKESQIILKRLSTLISFTEDSEAFL